MTVRTDADYLRFKLEDKASNGFDGGGMNGTFVLSKKLLAPDADETDFCDAHYTFQSGDHTGGTLDLRCQFN